MKKAFFALLAVVLIFSISACFVTPAAEPSASAAVSETSIQTEAAASAEKLSVRAGFLKGPTGIGAAYLMDQSEKGDTKLDYTFTLEADPTIMMSALIAGTVDIAAVPTSVAAALYNKTSGGVKIIAVNTLSVLYILENGSAVQNVADLKGKTIYAMGQAANPEYVLNYILRQNGLEPGKDVTVEYGDPGELATKMAAGSIDLCMLPVPNTTSVLMKNDDVRVALDLGREWGKITGGGTLTQGCVVVRSGLENLDTVVAQFLDDYWKSVLFIDDDANIEEASQLAFKYELVGSAALAKAAIPDCNLVYVASADEMKMYLAGYFDVLFKADPKSLGGAIPDDAFYYGG